MLRLDGRQEELVHTVWQACCFGPAERAAKVVVLIQLRSQGQYLIAVTGGDGSIHLGNYVCDGERVS